MEVAFTRDGARLISASGDGTLKIWDARGARDQAVLRRDAKFFDVTFTPDGSRFLVAQRETNNVTVFDWSTMAPLATVDVGTGPGGIACSADYAVVACGFSDEVYVIDLDDYTVVAVIPTGEQPWVVRVSPDGT